ncbi:hypothetical protein Q8G31_03405 [Priestia megaterium]|uniref:hypothetical protein n=1 Tax=Priestia TaxID=2800373 RepID=UPI0015CF186B|nr:hypothetical protein [Priestia megaterium]MBZ5479166.1 hypothetical protein [Bacillus sp. T_4]MDP1422907.1 hypothetical protein [Priestia megaterium]MED3868919.1 hypothetical protein [Priestia megaterium]
MIGEHGEDSCGKSGSDEEAQGPPAENEALHGNQQRCNKSFILNHFSHWFVFRLN